MDLESVSLILILAIASMGVTLASTRGEISGLDQLSPQARKEARSLQPAFEKIERYLGRSSVSDSVDSLMRRMKDIYKRKSWNLFSKLTRSSPQSSGELVRRALKLFISLPEAASSCDFKGYTVFAQNHVAIGQHQVELPRRELLRVLKYYSLRHANLCPEKYFFRFQEVQKHHLAQQEIRERLVTVVQIFEALRMSNCMRDSRGYDEQAEDLVIISPICVKQLMRQVLIVRKAKGLELPSLKEGFEFMWNGVRDSFDEYLAAPCRDYHKQYKEIFAPLIYDAAIMNDAADQNEFMLPKGQMSAGLQTFKACKSIIGKNGFLLQMMAAQIPQNRA